MRALERDGVAVLGLDRDHTANRARLLARLKRAKVDVIFHLAGPSSDGEGAIGVAADASMNLLEAATALPRRPLVIAVSSSAVYGTGPKGRAITERAEPSPETFYGAAKLLQEALARRASARGLPLIVARLFNVIGPGQSGERVPATFARRLLALAAARRPRVLQVRNVEAGRDLIDVADVVTALRTLAARGTPGETYNVCSGRARRIGDVIEALIARSGIDGVRVVHRDDGEVAFQRGSAGKLKALGWKPAVPLSASLDAILADWRSRS